MNQEYIRSTIDAAAAAAAVELERFFPSFTKTDAKVQILRLLLVAQNFEDASRVESPVEPPSNDVCSSVRLPELTFRRLASHRSCPFSSAREAKQHNKKNATEQISLPFASLLPRIMWTTRRDATARQRRSFGRNPLLRGCFCWNDSRIASGRSSQ